MADNGVADSIVDSAVAEGGAYEIIRKRLLEQSESLATNTRKLNEARLAEFGSTEMALQGRVRVRTENNCVARDIVQAGNFMLFGYNVFIGLKREIKVSDVFSLFRLDQGPDGYEMVDLSIDGSFLDCPGFSDDFCELYRYYKHARLLELTVKDGKLLAGFQIGERLEDIRVFRWSVSADGNSVSYIDNRGERDIQLPPTFDFEWISSGRDDAVHGRHPHVNILDTLFVETIAGDLTIKIENNTEDGLGIYSEPVEDQTQSLDDADIDYAAVGNLILLRIRPYREQIWRHLVFNRINHDVLRIDAIGDSCVQLPEDHGIIFPGGYYLQSGEYKTFDDNNPGFKFKRSIRSPNGEDVLQIFYEPEQGLLGLFPYSMIEKNLLNPLYGHGYALFEDGTLVIFSAEEEPTRIHSMQIWHTPYMSPEHASSVPPSSTFIGRIGNADLVRGVSDLFGLCRIIDDQSVSVQLYQEISRIANKMTDSHYWIDDEQMHGIGELLKDISATSELVIDEFEKVESIQRQSSQAMVGAERDQARIVHSSRAEDFESVEDYVVALDKLRHQKGHLATLKSYRYIDVPRITELELELDDSEQTLNQKTGEFLSAGDALQPYLGKIDELDRQVEEAETNAVLQPLVETIGTTAAGLDLLSELIATLKIEDTTVRTQIIDSISNVYAKLNQTKANAVHKQKSLGSEEATAQFASQFKLFSLSITNALGIATTPERCDEQLSRLLVRLEELDAQFSAYDRFMADIMDKREEIYESFETHKQQLLDDRQRRAQSVNDAAFRILSNIEKRSLKFDQIDDLNAYFAADALVLKIHESVEKLRQLDNAVKADDLDARFKAIKQQSLRALRDKTDIYENGGDVIKLGPRHKFSVNRQELGLTIIPRSKKLYLHITGTDYFAPVDDPALSSLSEYWDMSLESESPEVYRAEYLAHLILQFAETGQQALSLDQLSQAAQDGEAMTAIVRKFAAPRYKEGYQKGIHDHDAAKLLQAIVPLRESADLLRVTPLPRALAQTFWANRNAISDLADIHETWISRACAAAQLQSVFASAKATQLLVAEVQRTIEQFLQQHPIETGLSDVIQCARYLVDELGRERVAFIGSKYAQQLIDEFKRSLDDASWRKFQAALGNLKGQIAQRWNLTEAWLNALTKRKGLEALSRYIPEAIAMINAEDRLDRRTTQADLELRVSGLLGEHESIEKRDLAFSLDTFINRLENHQHVVIPEYRRYLSLRQSVIEKQRQELRLDEFTAKPLSSFVRNRLINEVYLPVIGDNFAKQMGTVGASKRTDLMGLLMMISPPGYGKTTLMEYVANRLGLIFMKINCPSLGHDVDSLDPDQSPNATAAQELRKLNLALEMGSNVMLYLDDIQHTNPEFLQKFISLCDGTRRIEGVWKGITKTYDMRGKKFCVVMAGNPYTESGQLFKIPDMLANRADIYNLGDILDGRDEQFALSYIENSLTSNAILAPLATREMADVYKFVDMAKGVDVAITDLSHQYSAAEVTEIIGVLGKLLEIQRRVLKVNQAYIASAAQDDKYRTEPEFKLQGSYRNMNKMAEKVSAVMNTKELLQMISDHYLGEAQLLTSGAEHNLLKLAQLRGNVTDQEQQRWDAIVKDFLRNKSMGGDDADSVTRVANQLAMVTEHLGSIHEAIDSDTLLIDPMLQISSQLEALHKEILGMQMDVKVINQPSAALEGAMENMAKTIETSFMPVVASMNKKIDLDLTILRKVSELSGDLNAYKKKFGQVETKSATIERSNIDRPDDI